MNLDSISCFSEENDCEYKMECLIAILNMTSDVIVNADIDGNISYLNSAAQKVLADGESFDLFEDVYAQLQKEAIPTAMQHGYWHGETKYVTKDGVEGYLKQTLLAQKWSPKQKRCFSSIVRDVTHQKRLDKQEILASNVLQNIVEGVVVTDANSTIISVNKAFTNVTGYTAAEVIGKKPNILSSGKHDASFYKEMWKDLTEKGFWKGEIWNRHKNGSIYLQHLKIKQITDAQGKIINYVSLIEDITERKKLEDQIQYQAYHDSLTQLPNRYFFNEKLEYELQNGSGNGAILLVDIERFKRITDTFGHQAGDELLLAVSDRLVRKVAKKGFVSRIESKGFIVLLPEYSEAEAQRMAEKLLGIFRYPFKIEEQDFMMSGCIGISLYPIDGTDVTALYKNVDAALLKAKEFGSNSYAFYHEVTEHRSSELLSLENSLYWALRNDQFELYYQPQLDIQNGKITGYEVLVRWNHPDRGMVPPMQFIPIAEDTGMIMQLDELILRKACTQMVEWLEKGYPPLRASVNVSMKNFNKRDIVSRLQRIIGESGIEPQQLIIELTESALMNNPDVAFHMLESIKQLGIEIALDDFGTGYSSLSYLRRLPIDYLKIDRSFIQDVTEDYRSAELVKTIVQLAKSLELDVVAEGIETKEQLQLMQTFGCTEAQGYYIGRPVPREQFEAMLVQQYNYQ